MRVDDKAILLLWTPSMIAKGLASRATAQDRSSVCPSASDAESPTNPVTNCFSSFPLRAAHLMTPLFPNISSLACAWEVHPLLSKVSVSNENPSRRIHRVPTVFRSGHEAGGAVVGTDPLEWVSLVSVEEIPSILSQTIDGNPLLHGSDYKLVKKIVMPPSHQHAGEEYMGMLPKPHYSIQEVLQHFHYGGFSLVIDSMQKRTASVANKARQVADSLGVTQVGVNLYLTPEAAEDDDEMGGLTNKQVRQGFEAHWDWMDGKSFLQKDTNPLCQRLTKPNSVIVVQISGRKRWSVAKEPTIYLSNKDQKRKPSKQETQYFASEDGHYLDFTLCPGDALYIPRGFLHNASTIDFEELPSKKGYEDAWDGCPAYHPDSAVRQSLESRLNGPSLHLTFGVERGCEGTMEALLHHALHAYFASVSSFDSTEIIPTCNVTWKSLLHYSLGEVARRKHECDNAAYNNGVHVKDGCGGNAILRQSVLLLPRVGNELNLEDMQQVSKLNTMYQRSIDSFLSLADMARALEFVKLHVMQPFDENLLFCFPGITAKDAIPCVDELLSATNAASGRFSQVVQAFVVYASANFDTAVNHMNEHVNNLNEKV